MNRNLFTIDDSEKRRILEMHQSATKNQYISEQTQPTVEETFTEVVYEADPNLSVAQAKLKEVNNILGGTIFSFTFKIRQIQLMDNDNEIWHIVLGSEVGVPRTINYELTTISTLKKKKEQVKKEQVIGLMNTVISELSLFSSKWNLGTEVPFNQSAYYDGDTNQTIVKIKGTRKG